ncbi:unnamed protein product [Cuscuta epithymum]|uniref:Protein kinase domain-containing protein n=1 Tax=Cuscuta epithymum TaxID=186058 RepID=A0AAV0DSV6_9ASTE|nr:unnamed protein product [Cuscuta epithymum]
MAAADSGRRKYIVHYGTRFVYKILSEDPIGRDFDNIPVYKVAYSVDEEENSGGGNERKFADHEFLSLKRVNYHDSESVLPFVNLYGEILRKNMAGLLLPCEYKHLMPVKAHFIEQETEDLCLVMPFCERGSLRSVMSDKFRHGLPETCISVALRYVLKSLKFLHRFKNLHRDINAGHIYVKSGPRIFLGFAGTLYEHGVPNVECSSHSSLPVTQICKWAAPPEVYCGGGRNDTYYLDYTELSDVWLVGITALELAYGTIRVPNREALETMIKEIIRTRRLPKKLGCGGIDDNREEEAHEEDKRSDKGKKKQKIMRKVYPEEEIRASFSRAFETMVADCLAWDPWNRPTASDLLKHEFFNKKGVTRSALKSHFQNAVIQMEAVKGLKNMLRVAAPDFRRPQSQISIPGITASFDLNLDPPSTSRRRPEPQITIPGHGVSNLECSSSCTLSGTDISHLDTEFKRYLSILFSSAPALTDVPFKLRHKRKLTFDGKEDEERKKTKTQEAESGVMDGEGMWGNSLGEISSASPVNSWMDVDYNNDAYDDTVHFASPPPPPPTLTEYLVDPDTLVVYRIVSMDPIGIASLGKLPVYRVAYSICDDIPYHREFVYNDFSLVKVVNSRSNPDVYRRLKNELESKNNKLKKDHENLLQVEGFFLDQDSWDYFIVMAYAEWGSLQSIMAEHFPHGLPETFISLILRSVLEAVCFLHQGKMIHGDISAGHVYVQSGPNIKMGFGATVYDHGVSNLECSSSCTLPETDISHWAAAPEVNNHERKNQRSTEESDVWLVGIMALELAYGGIRIPSREALEVMSREIHEKRRLPKRYPPAPQGLDQQQQQLTREVEGKGKQIVMEEEDYGDGSSEERSFSREFEKLVADCLAWKPWERPNARTLLKHEFFAVKGIETSELESHFEDVLIDRLRK